MAQKVLNTRVYVKFPKVPKKDWVKYLVVIDWHHDKISDVLTAQPSEEFNTFVMKTLQSYLDGKMPPAAIVSPIMNLAEDHLAGREMTLRAGDYIALQKAFQAAH